MEAKTAASMKIEKGFTGVSSKMYKTLTTIRYGKSWRLIVRKWLRVGVKTIKSYIFAKKLKLVFKKMLAFLDLGDPLVQIHLSLPRIASSRRARMERGNEKNNPRERERSPINYKEAVLADWNWKFSGTSRRWPNRSIPSLPAPLW